MKNVLVIGRCWKFLDFLIPTIDGLLDYNDNVDVIVLDSWSTRSKNIASYCKKLIKTDDIIGFIGTEKNIFGNIWHANQFLVDVFSDYEYICLTDLDMSPVKPERNWINKLTSILKRNNWIGAVSGDFEPMPPHSDKFDFSKDHPELKTNGEAFWPMQTDGWFYTVRSNEFTDFVTTGGRNKQMGPGMHGYNAYCGEIGKASGRTDLFFYHYGWLRYVEEWNSAYKETGINFCPEAADWNDNYFLALQGNWDRIDMPTPTRETFRFEMADRRRAR